MALSGGTHRMVWIPQGFAHGFLVLSEHALVMYKTTDYYAPEHERTIRWNDETLAIRWPLETQPIVSDKDRRGDAFRSADLFD
jgi:dTDP-4-dehydrorhamnose 3,5-epimerase